MNSVSDATMPSSRRISPFEVRAALLAKLYQHAHARASSAQRMSPQARSRPRHSSCQRHSVIMRPHNAHVQADGRGLPSQVDCPEGLDISQAVHADSNASSASLTYLHPPPAAMPGQATARELAARTLDAQPAAAQLTPRTPRPRLALTRHFLERRAAQGAAVQSSGDAGAAAACGGAQSTSSRPEASPRPGAIAIPRRLVDATRLSGGREPAADATVALAEDGGTVAVSPYDNALFGDTTVLDSSSLPILSVQPRVIKQHQRAHSAGEREPLWRPGLEPLQAMVSPPLSAEPAELRTTPDIPDSSATRPAPLQSQLSKRYSDQYTWQEGASEPSNSAAMLAAPAARAWKSLRSGATPGSTSILTAAEWRALAARKYCAAVRSPPGARAKLSLLLCVYAHVYATISWSKHTCFALSNASKHRCRRA